VVARRTQSADHVYNARVFSGLVLLFVTIQPIVILRKYYNITHCFRSTPADEPLLSLEVLCQL
ncbi:MAG: hypothetical protein AAGC64_12320, partial [Bacteroidota bacterium]